MLLGKVFKNIDQRYKSISFNNIRSNSKYCKANDIFFAIDGLIKNIKTRKMYRNSFFIK